ncbi:MAG: transcriptional regulator, MarR family [Humibacillus sp.]|nr:transcriptional regulator, MarR family [Humibacillus sp.]
MASRPESEPRPAHAPETTALRALGTASEDAAGALARRMAMHPTDLAAMSQIAYAAVPLGPRELSSRLGISPAAMTDVVDRLEEAGHLLRRRDTQDRRRVQLVPTESARNEVREQLAELLDALDAITDDFSAAERDAILRYLQRAAAAYERFAGDV